MFPGPAWERISRPASESVRRPVAARGFCGAVSAAVAVIALVGCESDASPVVDPGSEPRVTTGTAPQPTQGQGLFARIPAIVRQVEPSVVAVLTDRG